MPLLCVGAQGVGKRTLFSALHQGVHASKTAENSQRALATPFVSLGTVVLGGGHGLEVEIGFHVGVDLDAQDVVGGRQHIILVVFDVGDRGSFTHALSVLGICCADTWTSTTVLVGLKADVERRAVPLEEVAQHATEHGVPFIELSTLTGKNLALLQRMLVTLIGLRGDWRLSPAQSSPSARCRELMGPSVDEDGAVDRRTHPGARGALSASCATPLASTPFTGGERKIASPDMVDIDRSLNTAANKVVRVALARLQAESEAGYREPPVMGAQETASHAPMAERPLPPSRGQGGVRPELSAGHSRREADREVSADVGIQRVGRSAVASADEPAAVLANMRHQRTSGCRQSLAGSEPHDARSVWPRARHGERSGVAYPKAGPKGPTSARAPTRRSHLLQLRSAWEEAREAVHMRDAGGVGPIDEGNEGLSVALPVNGLGVVRSRRHLG